MKIRPLRKISDFVVEKLPEALESPSVALVEKCEELLLEFQSNLTLAQCIAGVSDLDIALLDLKMFESGIIHSDLTPPKQLPELVDALSESVDQLPALTYEDLIFINPLRDFRTFTRGEVKKTEKGFYLAHRWIEGCLEKVIAVVGECMHIKAVPSALESVPRGKTGLLKNGSQYVKEELQKVLKKTGELANMPAGHFTKFRKFLASHPVRKLKGPSGTFTARIPTLEFLLRGGELPESYVKHVLENMAYFPREGQLELQRAINGVQQNNTLVEIRRRRPTWNRPFSNPELDAQQLKGLIDVVGNFFNQFRKIHFGAVAKQIPEALKGNLAGTGGESNPGEFLRKRIKETKFRK